MERMMRQLELSYPWGTANLRVVERPDPTPGHGEVVVQMRAASLNFRDTIIAAQGGYARSGADAPPVVPFSDGCGVVEAVGPGVTRVAVGDRVATQFFPNWVAGGPSPEKAEGALGSPGAPGAGRELALFAEAAVAKVPDYLTDEEVACLPCAALTAWRALFVDANLAPGDTVVLQGTGGVSIFGLQFAHAAGLRTIVTSSSDEKLARARDLGADHVVNYRTTPQWSAPVREATEGRGADFVMEVGGAGTLIESLKSVRMGGHVAVIGVVSDVASPGATLSPGVMIATSARLVGVSVGSREMFEDMCRAMDLWQLRPVIGRSYDWTEAARAIDDLVQGQHFGKVVLTF
jgi:NADPH:quinone reductase-like Zn-dependent oxidoreductase